MDWGLFQSKEISSFDVLELYKKRILYKTEKNNFKSVKIKKFAPVVKIGNIVDTSDDEFNDPMKDERYSEPSHISEELDKENND
jgi:hypothetical protein